MDDDAVEDDDTTFPSGWWIIPALILGPFLWWGFFHLIGVL